MTDPEALPDEDLSAWPIDDDADEDFGWDWDAPPFDREPEPSGPPWYRSPGPLLTLIAAAAATLVVAVALVIVGSGEIPIRPALGTKTVPTDAPGPSRAAPPTESPTAPTTEPSTGESGPSTPASASSSAEEAPTEEESPTPAEDVEPEAGEPAAPAAAVPPAPLPVDSPGTVASGDSDGPRINVTRSPMSFSPGSSANG